jgi:hypothetical protein
VNRRLPVFPVLKDMNTKERLTYAYQVLAGIPEGRFAGDLREWISTATHDAKTGRELVDCGTLACAGGWLQLHPTFRRAMERNTDTALGVNYRTADKLFSVRTFQEHTGELEDVSDKGIVLYRILTALKDLGHMTQQKYAWRKKYILHTYKRHA